jgi:hypothetical protein
MMEYPKRKVNLKATRKGTSSHRSPELSHQQQVHRSKHPLGVSDTSCAGAHSTSYCGIQSPRYVLGGLAAMLGDGELARTSIVVVTVMESPLARGGVG